ncbi:LPXTG cell wall anchor domain-containing protein [Streptococcus merionis]|uniref:LPXTG cell wall anchor domain-containing protein n=1 Tax=Streptococcus merionis TaxID=400065 RepID=UPI003514B9CA
MTKKQLLTTLATSTLMLSSAGAVLAEEVTPVDPTAPSTEVVTPPTDPTPAPPATDTGASDAEPTDPTVPVDPTTLSLDPTPDQGKDNADDKGDVPGPDKDKIGENGDSKPTPDSKDKDATGDKDDANSGTTTVPTTDGGTATVTPDKNVPTNNPNISADTANKAGASQIGTTSTVTGQVVSNVSPNTPVHTNTGAAIISTQDGRLVLSDGSVVAPEAIGATTNADKTITVTKADGITTTLPETGEVTGGLFTTLSGLMLSLLSLGIWKRCVKQ